MREGEGERTRSCIVHSLPEHLKPHAYALKCQQPETLCNDFLSKLDGTQESRRGCKHVGEVSGQTKEMVLPKPTPRGGRESAALVKVSTLTGVSGGWAAVSSVL